MNLIKTVFSTLFQRVIKLGFFCVFVVLISCSGKQKPNVIIQGEISNFCQKEIVFQEIFTPTMDILQTITTDKNGLLLSVVVHAANEYDVKMAFDVINTLKYRFERMQKIYADGGYRGDELAEKLLNYELEITLRSDKATEFKPLPKRWAIERSFAWLN